MKIAFLGDIALIGKYDLTVDDNALSRLNILKENLKQYNYVIANLESPLTEKKSSFIPKSIHLRTSPRNIEVLKYLGINAVSLANNHTYDFGKKGLIDTINVLDKNGINWFGVNGKSLQKEIDGEKLSISGFCCLSSNGFGYINGKRNIGINTLTLENIREQLKKDEEGKAFSVLSFHWGQEHTNYPNLEHINLSQIIADKKNVLIHGHHQHVVQGITEYKKSLVAYSLGNCLFDECTSLNGKFSLKQNDENRKSFILEAEIKNSNIIRYKTVGFRELYGKIELFNIADEIKRISKVLDNMPEDHEYENLRQEQIQATLEKKFGKRNLNWLISRINYYSIGAKLTGYLRIKKYLKEAKKWKKGR